MVWTEKPFEPCEGGGRIEVDLCTLRFVAAPAGGREAIAALGVEVVDVAAVLETARRRGLAVSTRAGVAAVELCGVRFELDRCAVGDQRLSLRPLQRFTGLTAPQSAASHLPDWSMVMRSGLPSTLVLTTDLLV